MAATLLVNINTPHANDFVGVNISASGSVALLGGGTFQHLTDVTVQFGAGSAKKATVNGVHWECTGTVPSNTIGGRPLQISVSASVQYIPKGNPSSEPDSINGNATVVVIPENTPPQLSINPPTNITQPFPPYIATLTGTASDPADVVFGVASGVASVGWRLSNGSSGTAEFNPSNSQWSATISLPNVGDNPVTVKATDRFTNSTS